MTFTVGSRMYDIETDAIRPATQNDVDIQSAFNKSYDIFVTDIQKSFECLENIPALITTIKQAIADLDARRFLYVPMFYQDSKTLEMIEQQKVVAAAYFKIHFDTAAAKAALPPVE